MPNPTVGIGFSPSTPAAPTGDQNAVPQSDNGAPLQKVSFYPQKATASLRGTVKPDGTTTTVDGSGVMSAVQPSGAANEVLATPDGSSGTASLRALVAADVPSLPESKITNLTTDLAAKVPTSRTIATTAPLTGGGDLSADRTLAISAFAASGASHAAGAVPDPGATAGTTKFLREDATWAAPAGAGTSVTTKGDLQGFSTVAARVPVGADGTVLTADSTQALGVKYAAPGSGTGAMHFVGAWGAGTTYAVGDVVTYSGAVYMRLLAGGTGTTAHVQSRATALPVGVHSLAFASNVVAGNLLVIAFADEASVDPSTVTDTLGTTYTKVIAQTGNSNNAAIYFGLAPSSGANTVSFTSGGSTWSRITISEFSGVNKIANATAQVFQLANTSPVTLSITPTTSTSLIYVAIGGFHSACVFAPTTGFTLAAQGGGSDAIAGAYQFVSSSSAVTAGFAVTGAAADNSALVAAAFTTGTLTPPADTLNWIVL